MTGRTPSWDSASSGGAAGERAACPDCGCSVRVTHRGETEVRDAAPFICHCGTPMQPEPGDASAAAGGVDGDVRRQEDLLAQGGGAGAATGMGRTSSTSSSPGGG